MARATESTGDPKERLSAVAATLVVAAFAGLLAYAVLSVPAPTPSVAGAAQAELAHAGVENPVTAVLLSFRAYDTLLELAVLLLALVAVRSIAVAEPHDAGPPGTVLRVLNQLLVPFLIVFAGYLLWAGSSEPGGAFQAGAVLAAAGVLIVLAGEPAVQVPQVARRTLASLGVMAFLLVGFATLVAGGQLLEYRAPTAKAVILLLEGSATVAIGVGLVGVFRGGRSPGRGSSR